VQIASHKGLVEQVPSSKDKRVKNVALTAKGEQAIRKAARAISNLGEELEKSLSQRKLDAATKSLIEVSELLSNDK
jgi:DNA-binding MarR family transcriptional regulator